MKSDVNLTCPTFLMRQISDFNMKCILISVFMGSRFGFVFCSASSQRWDWNRQLSCLEVEGLTISPPFY